MIRRALLGLAAALLFSGAALAEVSTPCSPAQAELKGDNGTVRFSVEIADTAAERAQGLMYREKMATSEGMLFFFERPQKVSFWMKNTLIPLDMLFISPQGRVEKIHENAIPGDLTPIQGGSGILAVLEINGGLARRLGIKAGSIIRHPGFDQSNALWACSES